MERSGRRVPLYYINILRELYFQQEYNIEETEFPSSLIIVYTFDAGALYLF